MGDTETICNPCGLQGMYSAEDIRKGLGMRAIVYTPDGLVCGAFKHEYRGCTCALHNWWRWMNWNADHSPRVSREKLQALMAQLPSIGQGGKKPMTKVDPWFEDLS